jgi:hypothetical protein
MDESKKATDAPAEPIGPFLTICLACRQTFEAAKPSGRICPNCHDELDRLLLRTLQPVCPPDTEPLAMLFSVPRRRP